MWCLPRSMFLLTLSWWWEKQRQTWFVRLTSGIHWHAQGGWSLHIFIWHWLGIQHYNGKSCYSDNSLTVQYSMQPNQLLKFWPKKPFVWFDRYFRQPQFWELYYITKTNHNRLHLYNNKYNFAWYWLIFTSNLSASLSLSLSQRSSIT